MPSVTLALADERHRHYLACKQIIGVRAKDDYPERDLVVEALKEAADLVNYLNALGAFALADEAALLGDRIIAKEPES